MIEEPRWLDEPFILKAQARAIATHGGLPGVRDEGALRSALNRPVDKWSYGRPDVFDLAAAYGFALARNHAFNDGNKRIAYIATRFFLLRNGLSLNATDPDKIGAFLALASGDLSEDALADWLRSRAVPA